MAATRGARRAGAYAGQQTYAVALYSDDRIVRQQVRLALGQKVAADLPDLEFFEFATPAALVAGLGERDFDLAILDGEAVPEGGMGLAHQIKDESAFPVPIILLVARAADAWLAAWSRADGISSYPIDPIRLPQTVAEVLRAARAGVATPFADIDEQDPGVGSRH
ncbi:MAG: response regulator [Propionibacteriaceae bacterium]|nr:response regulator [Propionibacteriaceae bacterium]